MNERDIRRAIVDTCAQLDRRRASAARAGAALAPLVLGTGLLVSACDDEPSGEDPQPMYGVGAIGGTGGTGAQGGTAGTGGAETGGGDQGGEAGSAQGGAGGAQGGAGGAQGGAGGAQGGAGGAGGFGAPLYMAPGSD